MNSEQHSHFISRRLDDHKRAAHRSLHCHICTVPAHFRGEHGFLEHLQKSHPDSAVDAPDGPIFKAAVQQAAAKAKQRDPPKAAIEHPPPSRQSSGDSLKPNLGDAQSVSISSRPVSSGMTKDIEPRIDEFKRLSLNQNSGPGLIPLKRAAVGVQQSFDAKNRKDSRSSPKARRTRGPSHGNDAEFERGTVHPSKKLYDPNADRASFGRPSSPQLGHTQDTRPQRNRPVREGNTREPSHHHHQPHRARPHTTPSNATGGELHTIPVQVQESTAGDDWDEEEPELLLQPETRPVSNEQLEREVKGIYSGLVLLETQCMKVDERQLRIAQDPDPAKRTPVTPSQWSALISLHKALLHEHYDFFLASQHPSAEEALMELADKYSMPARMWKYGIHALLEVLEHNLPKSLDFMLNFLNVSYSMVALLYETTPAFADNWVECLGDLGRRRMVIGDNDQNDHEVWAGVARQWYARAVDKHPDTGRLWHHLGLLAKPYSISQLSLYCRALSTIHPFNEAKQRIMIMFGPVLAGQLTPAIKQNSMDTLLIRCLGVLFTGRSTQEYIKHCQNIIDQGSLSKYCDRAGSKFKETGVAICISTLSGLLEFGATRPDGSSRSIVRRAFQEWGAKSGPSPKELSNHEKDISTNLIIHACKLAFGVFAVGLEKRQDRNIIPMIHAYAAFLKTVAPSERIMQQIEMDVPWSLFVAYLNHYTNPGTMTKTCLGPDFPKPAEDVIGRPLPEDFVMRGQILFYNYFPSTWFSDADVDDEEKLLELPSMAAPRLSRILWNGVRIASHKKWIIYNSETFRFAETDYAKSLKPRQTPKSFLPGILSPELEQFISPPLGYTSTPDIPTAPDKSDTIALETAESPSSPRQTFTQTPKILKRTSRTDVNPSVIRPNLP